MQIKNNILQSMMDLVNEKRADILVANQLDLEKYDGGDQAMYDRLKIDNAKIEGMLRSIQIVMEKPDPINVELSKYLHPKGMMIKNKTSPFGTILIIYESRPDVTIEAAVIAFKAGNRILLKGGKEAHQSNIALVNLWQEALQLHSWDSSWIQYLNYNRVETQAFLKAPTLPVDLIVPRGGERLIEFVKTYSKVPVLVSGRGNNFMYIHSEADWQKALSLILNAKTSKISACNALDKLLIDQNIPNLKKKCDELTFALQQTGVQLLVGKNWTSLGMIPELTQQDTDEIWKEEFLSLKILIDIIDNEQEAIQKINQHSGGHSACIVTENKKAAEYFMNAVDVAAVYHNVSTRFTDGGEFGMGAELAISTDKLHHRGPLGLQQLVTNKWFVYGSGQVR